MKLSNGELRALIGKAYDGRVKVVKMMSNGSIHLGGALSCIDVLTVLYYKIMNHDPANPSWEDRDRFILSAGHKAVALYAILQDCGFFRESALWTYHRFKSEVPEHPDEKSIPGIEFPTGSLGHGLSAGSGMAIAGKMDRKNHRVFVLLGDGECAEGTVWEAAMASAHYHLDNLTAIIDRNGLQVNGKTKDVMNTDCLEDKFSGFGWVVRTVDGHDYNELFGCFNTIPFEKGKPSCVIANTVKSKGVSFAEGDYLTHHCRWDDSMIRLAIESVEENKLRELQKVGGP